MTSTSTIEKRRRYDGQKLTVTPSLERRHFHGGDDEEKKSDSSLPYLDDKHHQHAADFEDGIIRQPQHLMPPPNVERKPSPTTCNATEDDSEGLTYYRVVYRGVVALLSQPDQGSSRSGCYLGYGEVVASRCQIAVVDQPHHDDDTDNKQHQHLSAIRVDQVLTGGYAFDPPTTCSHLLNNNSAASAAEDSSETPKKSNIQGYTTTAATATAVGNSSSSPATSSVNLAISKSSSSSSSDEDNAPLDLSQLEASTAEANIKRCEHEGVHHHGFVFSHNRNRKTGSLVPIVQPLSRPPTCQHGRFFYKIVSTTPLPILSGPSTDAPLSKAMVLPGTVHEVSFRICIAESDEDQNGILFLRLGRRKGYIASRRIGRRNNNFSLAGRSGELLVKDVTEEINAAGIESTQSNGSVDDATTTTATTSGTHNTSSVLSVLSTSMASSTTARNPNRRHRPPRRRRDNAPENPRSGRNQRMQHANNVNNHNANNTSMMHNQNDTSTLTNISVQSHSSDRLHQTPSSNVSLLSEDDSSLMDIHQQQQQQQTSFSSHEHNNSHRFHGALSPDRSVARSVMSNQSSQQQQQHSTFYLMRVTAPRGLRILDAPHFQVNNLIHGTQQSAKGGMASTTLAPNGSTDVAALSGLHSTKKNQHHLFHTMAGRITTTNGIASMDNAVIFDAVTKTRILPRGAVFEASKRMESSDALFHQGAGLIKLADNSGWAIVPHQNDLEQQYRNFHGGASSVKEGEALRGGYEEIGNAVVFQGAPSESLDHSFCHPRKADSSSASTLGVFMRVVARPGATVVCAPPAALLQDDTNNQSPSSSPASSAVSGGTHPDQLALGKSDSASDVASSVGSSFLDAMFRGTKRSEGLDHTDSKQGNSGASAAHVEKPPFTSTTIVSLHTLLHFRISTTRHMEPC